MATIRLNAEITEDGALKVHLPSGLPPGKVQLEIQFDDIVLNDEDLHELLRTEPLTGTEIVTSGLTGGWKSSGIADGASWVEGQRRKRREQRGW
jgi:hypothetical protein